MLSYFKRVKQANKIINDYQLQSGIDNYKSELSFVFSIVKTNVSLSYAKYAIECICKQSNMREFEVILDDVYILKKTDNIVKIMKRNEY